MKNFSFRSIAVLAVSLLFAGCTGGNAQQTDEAGTTNRVIEVIHQRTSIRSYQKKEVPREVLEDLVKAGMAAPSAMNAQPWHFIVVDDGELLQKMGEEIPTSKMVQQAPAAILVCGDLTKAGKGWQQEYWIQDCSAASQNILLAITELGLGGVWTGIYPAENRMERVVEILNLPDYIIPLNIIPVGYPSNPGEPKDKWDPANVHWNVWE